MLTDVARRLAKPKDRQCKLADGQGFYLLVRPAGGKLWRLKYHLAGKEKLAAFGAYPEVISAEARKSWDEAREQIAASKDSSREKRRAQVQHRAETMNTLGTIFAEYCAKRRADGHDGWAPATAKRSEHLLSRLNAALGSLPIGEIEPADIPAAIRKIESKGRWSARAIDSYESLGLTRLALQLAPHVFVRPGELRHARWDETDLDGVLWSIPAEKTKIRKSRRVPLFRQSVPMLRKVHALTGPAGCVFPSVRNRARPMSENTLNAGLRRLGGEAGAGEHASLRFVHTGTELWPAGARLVGGLAPDLGGSLLIRLQEDLPDRGGGHGVLALGYVGQGIAHEVDVAALPGGALDAGDRTLEALPPLRGVAFGPGAASQRCGHPPFSSTPS